MAGSGDIDGEVAFEFAHCIHIFKGGRVERYFGSDPVPASTDAATGVASKDRDIYPDVSVRLYLPPVAGVSGEGDRKNLPLIVYFHGGGFCLHTAFNVVFHAYLTSLAARTRAIIVSVEYRLAPEHPLPDAYEDSWQAVVWAASHASGAGAGEEAWLTDHANFSRMYLAGANIAHNVAMRAGAEGLPHGVVLVHPYFLGRGKVPSEDWDPAMAENMVRMWRVVCPVTTGVDDPWINPLADGAPALDGLTCGRVLVCLAEKDVISDRGRASGWPGEVEVVGVAGPGRCVHLVDFNCDEAVKQDDVIAEFVNR